MSESMRRLREAAGGEVADAVRRGLDRATAEAASEPLRQFDRVDWDAMRLVDDAVEYANFGESLDPEDRKRATDRLRNVIVHIAAVNGDAWAAAKADIDGDAA